MMINVHDDADDVHDDDDVYGGDVDSKVMMMMIEVSDERYLKRNSY